MDDPHILEQFDLGHRWSQDREGRFVREGTVQRSVAPEVLFVERCVQWVKPGTGKVAIVLPDGILGNPDAEHIRYWILQHCQVLASVDLPVEAFLPQVGVQASLLFLRRKSQAEMDAEAMGRVEDYPVFMAIAETVGHDRRGNTIYLRDPDGAETFFTETRDVLRRRRGRLLPVTVTAQEKRVDDDLPRIADGLPAVSEDRAGARMKTATTTAAQLEEAGRRLDASYHASEGVRAHQFIREWAGQTTRPQPTAKGTTKERPPTYSKRRLDTLAEVCVPGGIFIPRPIQAHLR